MNADPEKFFDSSAELMTVGGLCTTALEHLDIWFDDPYINTKLLNSNYAFGAHAINAGEQEPDDTKTPFCYVIPLARTASRRFYHLGAKRDPQGLTDDIGPSWEAITSFCQRVEEKMEPDYLRRVEEAAAKGDEKDADFEYKGGNRIFELLRALDDNPLRRKDVQERPIVAAARVKDYLKEVHLHITGYKFWVADESFVDEIFLWRRAMALLRHLVETAWFFSTVPEVTQAVRNWFDETGILVHMEDAMKVAEEKWQGYDENSMDPIKKEKKPYTATVCRNVFGAIEESLKKLSDVFFNGEPIESGKGSYEDFENIVEEDINNDLQRMTELDEQGNRVDNEGNKEGVDGFVDLEELRSKLQNLDRREE